MSEVGGILQNLSGQDLDEAQWLILETQAFWRSRIQGQLKEKRNVSCCVEALGLLGTIQSPRWGWYKEGLVPTVIHIKGCCGSMYVPVQDISTAETGSNPLEVEGGEGSLRDTLSPPGSMGPQSEPKSL